MFQALWVSADLRCPNHCKLLGVQLTELKSALYRWFLKADRGSTANRSCRKKNPGVCKTTEPLLERNRYDVLPCCENWTRPAVRLHWWSYCLLTTSSCPCFVHPQPAKVICAVSWVLPSLVHRQPNMQMWSRQTNLDNAATAVRRRVRR